MNQSRDLQVGCGSDRGDRPEWPDLKALDRQARHMLWCMIMVTVVSLGAFFVAAFTLGAVWASAGDQLFGRDRKAAHHSPAEGETIDAPAIPSKSPKGHGIPLPPLTRKP